jgi:hypothetical protein
MGRGAGPLQGADIFFVQASRGRNQSCHHFQQPEIVQILKDHAANM